MILPATETLANGTPILDRMAPLPPRTVPGSGLAVLLAVWVAAAIILAVCWIFNRPPILRQWFLTDLRPWFLDQWTRIGIIGLGASTFAAFYLMLAVHELGHVVAGLSVGFRCRSYRVGPLRFNHPLRVSLYRGPGAIVTGVAELDPITTNRLAWRGMAMVLGGALANFLTAVVVLLLPLPITAFSGFFVVFSIANGMNDLFPFESRLGISDGRRIWMLLRQPQHGERWLALLRLSGELTDGVLPESLSAEFLAKAIAVQDDSADTVKANAMAFSSAFYQQKDSEAAKRLETCLAYSDRATPALREALKSDAAVYQARRRKRADLAVEWLAEIPVTAQYSWLRARAEAAILEANGDFEGAMKKLVETETAILAIPKNAHRDTLLRLLQRWKAELCPA